MMKKDTSTSKLNHVLRCNANSSCQVFNWERPGKCTYYHTGGKCLNLTLMYVEARMHGETVKQAMLSCAHAAPMHMVPVHCLYEYCPFKLVSILCPVNMFCPPCLPLNMHTHPPLMPKSQSVACTNKNHRHQNQSFPTPCTVMMYNHQSSSSSYNHLNQSFAYHPK